MSASIRPERRDRLLWIAFAAPAVAWFVQLTANYTIAAYACANDQTWILHAISVAAFALAAAGVWSGWTCLRLQSSHGRLLEPGADRLAAGTLLLAVLFALGIVWNELSNWALQPCL